MCTANDGKPGTPGTAGDLQPDWVQFIQPVL